MTRILAIETSCDETAAAVIADGRSIVSSVVASQAAQHSAYGGVFPEVAARMHVEVIATVVSQALAQAHVGLAEVDAVAVTRGPGLPGSLVVGVNAAKGLAFGANKPLLGINHLEGHVYSPWLLPDREPPAFPAVVLIVSGGHTELLLMRGHNDYQRLGSTLDDAAGEAFDKTAKLLGLPYPGGAALSDLAQRGRPDVVRFPRPMLHSGDFDFSFSGLKTAVLTKVREIGEPDEQQRADIARGFQDAIVEVLVKKSMRAVKESGLTQLVVAGGVGANRELRRQLDARAAKAKISVFYPELEFCTDNGAMIALAGALRFQAGKSIKPAGAFAVRPRWPLAELTH